MQIYLDYSATTPARPEVITAMNEAMAQHWGNPSSLHQWGNQSATALERSRTQVANLINSKTPTSIIFTAGGSEANNLAIKGVTRTFVEPQHLIISAVEHSAITAPASQLMTEGWQVTQLPVDSRGAVNPEQLRQAIQDNTVLISIIYGQSEVGTLQPIDELGAIARAHNILFHTDAVQVAGRLPIDVQQLPVDLLSLSSHKIYGPQGAGALYISPDIKPEIKPGILQPNLSTQDPSAERPLASNSLAPTISPIIFGGGQENGLRSGTQAVPNIVGFGVAAELANAEMATETLRLIHLRDRLFAQLADIDELAPTGDPRHRLPHHVSFCLPRGNVTGKALVRHMNFAGIGISAGSACHSGKLSPSPILKAMGHSDASATSGIRLTLGRHTTEADIDWSAMVLRQVLGRLLPVALVQH